MPVPQPERFVPVEQWCGYIDHLTGISNHPPHLWGEVIHIGGMPFVNIYPCPGERSTADTEGSDD